MDPTRFFMRLFGRAVETAADWHSDHEALVGDQVIAIALPSREGFVQYRRRLYLVPAEDIGWMLPGHRLSAVECRGLFGADGQRLIDRRLEVGAFSRAEVEHGVATGLARLVLTGPDGVRREWSFPTLAAAEDLVSRLEGMGVLQTGGA